jgi:hypothetical protein
VRLANDCGAELNGLVDVGEKGSALDKTRVESGLSARGPGSVGDEFVPEGRCRAGCGGSGWSRPARMTSNGSSWSLGVADRQNR